jgi:ketosteroid isomerase-like protein
LKTTLLALLVAGSLSTLPAHGQGDATQTSSIDKKVIEITQRYLEYYNKCDVDKLIELHTSDVEVYHDQAGFIIGKPEVKKMMQRFCTNMPGVRAELVGDLEIYEMKKQDNTYGAIVKGMLSFYFTDKQSGKETKESTSDLIWLLRTNNNMWQISRDFSYNHEDSPSRK